jgi:hypothetical protein
MILLSLVRSLLNHCPLPPPTMPLSLRFVLLVVAPMYELQPSLIHSSVAVAAAVAASHPSFLPSLFLLLLLLTSSRSLHLLR